MNSSKYAELREGEAGKFEVIIESQVWTGLINPDGYQGYKVAQPYWAYLQGDGPEYVNPEFKINGVIPRQPYLGKIIVDRAHLQVTIALQTIISRPNEPLKTEPCQANGVYKIKSINSKPFNPLERSDSPSS